MTKIANWSPRSPSRTEGLPSLALIGCGGIAESYYLPGLAARRPILQKLILVDSNQTRMLQMAKQFGVETSVDDYRRTLGKVDGAIVATPIHLHQPIVMDFLSLGIPVLCEKPLAESADKARQMVEEALRSGAALATNYLQRLIPSFAKVKELMISRELGEPLSIEYLVGEEFDAPTVSGFYFNSPVSGRGVLRDRGAHVIDHICWWLGGKPKLVTCQTDSFGGSDAVAEVKFEYGRCEGRVKLSWLANFPSRFTVVFERGSVSGDVYDYTSVLLRTGDGPVRRIELRSKERSKKDVAAKIIDNFISVISGDEEPLVPGSGVLESIEFVDDCYLAATRFDMPWYQALGASNGR